MPAEQAVHDEDPDDDEYVPAAQFVHAMEPARAYVPATHAPQLDNDDAPLVARDVPRGQLVQLDPPVLLWYQPALHVVQLVALAEEYVPTEHAVHKNDAEDDEYNPEAHATHTLATLAPTMVE